MTANVKLRSALLQLHTMLIGDTCSPAVLIGARGLIEQALAETVTPAAKIPDTVTREQDRDVYFATNLGRGAIKAVAESVSELRTTTIDLMAGNSETVANITLAYRHLEDASMRLGKALQSIDGGASVYDKSTTVGA